MTRKPIKRSPQILPLSREHHFSLLFCWKIRQGLKKNVEKERIIKYVDYFYHHFILPHFGEEEKVLFCLLKDEKVDKALNEHTSIKQLTTSILNAGQNANSDDIEELARLVDLHTRYEERELFPYIEERLSLSQLEEAGRQLGESEILSDDFEDEFWVNK
ncbi:hemerythrin domain-containing protein [Arachidicoccus sp.]|uniref:hemerythrin domain-containing protein n=1 Tax=Arachidicoccus sp. TaxID=1872624 RepID=UPI003D24F6E3